MWAALKTCGLRGFVLLLALGSASPAASQTLDLGGLSPPVKAGLGDTLVVGIRASTGGRQLTSVGVTLQYDAAILQPQAQGGPFALQAELFPQAVIYENAATTAGAAGTARARLVAVSPTATGAARQVLRGDGLLATISFIVVGFADSARVHIVSDGADRPLYTVAGRPGIQQGFQVSGPGRVAVALEATGFLALPDVQTAAGRVAALSLRGRTASASTTWNVRSRTPDLINAWVQDDSLMLQSPVRRAGLAVVDYEAIDGFGQQVGSGSLDVTIDAAPALLRDPQIAAQEDFGTLRYPLEDFLEPGAAAFTFQWGLSATPPLGARIEAGELVLSAPLDWSGPGRITLRLTAGRDELDTLQIMVPVAATNDAPQIRLPDAALNAVVGTRTVGPNLADWIVDVDDDEASLQIDIDGDGVGIEAWQQDARLQLRGLQAGRATVTVRVTDPSGATAEGILSIDVTAAGQAPAITPPSDVHMRTGERLALPLALLVSDADNPSSSRLRVAASATGAVAVAVTGDSLILSAASAGVATVQLSVTDDQNNAATAVWQIRVVDADPTDTEPEPEPGPELSEPGLSPEPEGPDMGEPELPASPGTFAFGALARLQLAAGTQGRLDVSASLESADRAQAYAVTGATFVQVEIDGDSGMLQITAPAGSAGREVLLLSAVGTRGQVAATTLEVLVVDDVSTGALRLRRLPDLHLDSDSTEQIDLDPYAAGAQGVVTWSTSVAGDMITVSTAGRLLRVTSGSVGGQVAVLLTATDEAGRRASELLHVHVRARSASAGSSGLRIEAPAALTVTPGTREVVDLKALVEAGVEVAWQVADAAGLIVELSGDSLWVQAAQGASAGWHDIELQAATDNAEVLVRLTVAVSALPVLALHESPSLTMVAGLMAPALDLRSLVSIGDPRSVQWTVDGGVLLTTTLTDSAVLMIDASRAVPGREVLQLSASLDGDLRSQSVAVLVRAPRITVAAPDTMVLIGSEAAILLDGWVEGELDAARLLWRVTDAPAGIVAGWDENTRRLQVAGAGNGIISLQARLASGLQVAVFDLAIQLTPPAAAEPIPTPDSDPVPVWSLQAATLDPLAAGDTLRVPLGGLVLGDEPRELTWRVLAGDGDGEARIDGSMLELTGAADFDVTLEAWGLSLPDDVRRLRLRVPVQAPGAPWLQLDWVLTAHAEGAQVRVTLQTEADVTTQMTISIDGEHIDFVQGATTNLPLPEGGRRIEVAARAQRAGVSSVDTLVLQAGWLGASAQLWSPDSLLAVRVPAGLPGAVGLVWGRARDGAVQLTRTGAAGPLLLQAAHAGTPWTTLQARSDDGWRDLPGVERTARDVRAFTDGTTPAMVYRAARSDTLPVASDAAPVAEEGVGAAFPNPFNASVTLPVSTGQASAVTIYDATGRVVRTFTVDGPGAVHWNGTDESGRRVASGVYFYRVLGAASQPALPRAASKVLLLR